MKFFIFCSESKIKDFPHCAGSRTSIKRERNTLSVVSIAPKSFRYVEEKNRKNLEREAKSHLLRHDDHHHRQRSRFHANTHCIKL